MTRNNKCTECEGLGAYKVYNAYNPEDIQEVRCEYCLPKVEKTSKLALN